ncbi:MAG: Tm-1-like ATP-binding domain-containing protein, partial [Pirellulaceae bacterium]|nr:Tm-1-like ATP-binding domain-containing protein [Pirellulaceae bacterium]
MTESRKLTIAVMGTLDTKGAEHEFVADCIRRAGHQVLLIDVSTGGAPSVTPDISRDEVLQAFNSRSQVAAEIGNDRGASIAAMTQAVPDLLRRLVDEDRIHGLVSLGGSGGTAIATAAMRALPLGFPKVMVSTMTGGNTAQYVGISDIVMLPSIVDVSGLNRLSRRVFMR